MVPEQEVGENVPRWMRGMSSLSLVASPATFPTWEHPPLRGCQRCSPPSPGEQTPPHDHVCLSDEVNHQNSTTSTKDRGTSTESPCRRTAATQMAPACVASSRPPEKHQATSRPPPHGASVVVVTTRGPEAHRDRIRYQTDVRLEATEEIYLTPVQKNSDPLETDKPFLSQSSENRMSISSDIDTSGYSALAGKTNPSISEEDEVLDYMSSPDKTNLPRASCGGGSGGSRPGHNLQRASVSSDTSALSYDSVKYTLVVDENMQLELVSLKQCYSGYSDESDSATVYDNCVSSPYESAIGEEYEEDALKRDSVCLSEDSTPEADIHFSKKFLNVFMSGRARSSSECWVLGWGEVGWWLPARPWYEAEGTLRDPHSEAESHQPQLCLLQPVAPSLVALGGLEKPCDLQVGVAGGVSGLLFWLVQGMAALRGEGWVVSQGDSIPPGVSPSSLSPEEHWGWWQAPAGRASWGAARPTVLVTPVVTATWGGTGRSWSQRGPPGPSAAALAVPFSRVAPRGFA